jgi:hypothetical protein
MKIIVEDLPNGYPRASAYLNSDVGTTLFRRFGTLHSRALLYKQHELTELEAKLEKMDRDDAETVETSWRNSRSINRRDGEDNEDKKALIEEIVTKLEEYGTQLALVSLAYIGYNADYLRRSVAARCGTSKTHQAIQKISSELHGLGMD